MKNKIFIAGFFFLLLVIGSYLFSAHKVKQYQRLMPASERASAFMVSPELMKIGAGEFKGLMADYLLLKASTFLGGRYSTTEKDWNAVATLFSQSLALDPYFFQTCYYIQATLPWEAKMPEKAVKLIAISKKHRFWDWNPGFFEGFDYFYFLKDNLTASKILMETSRMPDAPTLIGLLGARLAQKGGKTKTAIIFLKAMYKKTEDKATKKEIELRIKALSDVLILESGIAAFVDRFGHQPKTLEELTANNILKKLPENPYKKPYTYKNGQIGF